MGELERRIDDPAVDRLGQLARVVLRLSRPWAVAMVIAAGLSTLRVAINPNHVVSGSFEVRATTVVLLALIWLPAVVRVLTVAGGGVKTPAGEASTPGLLSVFEALDPDTKRETLGPVVAALTSPGVLTDPQARHNSESYRRDLEWQLASVVPRPPGGIREALDDYARQYEALRNDTEPGRPRTLRMTTLTAEARSLARAAPLSTVDIRNMLANGSDGERVVALSLLQDRPDPRLLSPILDAIVNSRSAFEQYQALAASFEVLPVLDKDQQEELHAALMRAQQDPRSNIGADTSRQQIINAALQLLDQPAEG